MVPNSKHDYQLIELGKMITLQYGEPLREQDRVPGCFDVFGSNGKIGTHHKYLIEGPGIIVGRKGSAGVVSWSSGNFWAIDTTYYVEPLEGHYLKYLYFLLDYINLSKLCFLSGVPGLNRNYAYDFKVPIAPIVEQKKIASILSTVDETIEKTQAVINQIEVVKKGLMQQLLTKGIPGWHKEYKHTELGAIPKNWGFVKLKEVCEWIGVGIASSATHAYSDIGIPILRNLNIKEGYIDSSDLLYLTPEFAHAHSNKQIKTGDLITVRTGYPGISAVVPDKFNGCQTFTTLISRPLNKLINSDFLCYWINSESGKQFVFSSKFGGAQQNLNVKILEKMPLVLPPLAEQKKIAAILTSIDQRLEAEKAKKAQLETIKKGLMQQLLTGKRMVKI